MKECVTETVRKGLCCSCGLCSEYCKSNAITYKVNKHGFYIPIVDSGKCVGCKLCLNSCPGINDLMNYSNHVETYLHGYSLDQEMRMNASSGGVTTELLCYLIEKKIVDFVTCVTNRTADQMPMQILTNNLDVIRSARTSKYCPVKWDGIISEIEKVDGSVAVVALPCQVNSLKKYFSNRKHKVKFFISLLCNHTPSLYATDYLVKAVGGGDFKSIVYRGNGFPGYMKMVLSAGNGSAEREINLPFRRTWAAGYGRYFKNLRCIVCNDPFANSADVVMGDSYFLQESDRLGTTFCIVRNQEISKMLSDMSQKGIIHLEEGPESNTIHKYYDVLFRRQIVFGKYNAILKLFGRGINTIEKNDNVHLPLAQILRFLLSIFISGIGRYRFLWPILARRNQLQDLAIFES